MIFSKKEKPVVAYTVEKCTSCGKEQKREFRDGDMLFAESSECSACKAKTSISKIFGQTIE